MRRDTGVGAWDRTAPTERRRCHQTNAPRAGTLFLGSRDPRITEQVRISFISFALGRIEVSCRPRVSAVVR